MIIVMAFAIVCLFAMLFVVAASLRQIYRRLEALEDATRKATADDAVPGGSA